MSTPGTDAPAAAPVAAGPAPISFVDAPAAANPADALLETILAEAGGEPAAAAADPAAPDSKAEPAKPEPAKVEPPANDVEAARLRKGFAKLAEERQKVLDLQNAARADKASAQQYAEKAQKHDELVAALEKDPYSFLHGRNLIDKVLQGAIDAEKSPEARRLDELERQTKAEKEASVQREQETVVKRWREDIVQKVAADERFDLVNTFGLHNDVIDVITQYYEKHSERDEKGNVTVPALLSWDIAAEAVESTRAAKLENSKRYGKRAPAAEDPKDAPKAKEPPAQAKRAPTSLSSVPVAEAPSKDEEFEIADHSVRERQVLAALGLD